MGEPSVLKLVTCGRGGAGGHYYSLRDIGGALADAGVPVVGVFSSGLKRPATKFEGLHAEFFEDTVRDGSPRTVAALLGAIRRLRPDVLHSYDAPALLYARVAGAIAGLPVVHTQCGGPNPRFGLMLPVVRDLVLFSRENLSFYEALRRFRRTRLHLLPGRVRSVHTSPERVAELRARLDLRPDEVVFLRINRLVGHYERSSMAVLELGRRLRARGLPVRVVVVGTAQDPAVAERVRAAAAPEGFDVISEERFTRNAAELIDVADVLLGTGRGLMEAASLGKPLLCPLADRPLPALVTADNVEALGADNFSPRCTLPDGEDALLEAVARVVASPKARVAAGAFSREAFERSFRVDVETYRRIYARAHEEGGSRAALPRSAAALLGQPWLTRTRNRVTGAYDRLKRNG